MPPGRGGAPTLSTLILVFCLFQGPPGRAGMKGEIGFPGRPIRPAPGLFVSPAIASAASPSPFARPAPAEPRALPCP